MNNIKFLLSVSILLIAPFFVACSNDLDCSFIEIEEENLSKTDNVWKKQLDNVLRKQTRNASQKLSLIGYDYHKEVASLADLDDGLDEIFADTAYIAYQNYVDYDFEIYKIGDAKTSEYDSIRTRIDFDLFRTSIYIPLRPAVEAGHKLHLIKLKWLYKGNVIYSIAIATDEQGVFFDTIGHYIVTRSERITNTEEDGSNTLPRTKTRSEMGNGTILTDSIKNFKLEQSFESYLGYTAFSYCVRCESVFSKKGGTLVSRSSSAIPNVGLGYSGGVELVFTEESRIGVSDFNEFHWKWAYGFAISNVALSVKGVSIEISGDPIASGEGSETHRL